MWFQTWQTLLLNWEVNWCAITQVALCRASCGFARRQPGLSLRLCKEAVTSGLIAVLEQHKFIVLLKGMRDILSKLNLLNVSMQTQSLPFSTLKVLVNATREGLKREWIDLSAAQV